MRTETTHSASLRYATIYVAFDRFVCASPRCAGSTALATGHDIDGHELRPVDEADLREWAGYDLGPLKCECGRLSASATETQPDRNAR
jgi:hypothetical protein